MPMQRVRATALARLLNSADRPIYVLDSDRTIVFCNQALLAAIGPAAIDLLGRRCAYHGCREAAPAGQDKPQPLDAETTAAALCPPPQAMAGHATTATVSWVREDGSLHQRLSQFIPLTQNASAAEGLQKPNDRVEDVIAVVALVGSVDLGKSDTRPSEGPDETVLSETARLHRRVREFYHATASQYRLDRLIGDSDAIRLARRRVELAYAVRAGVLIVGPPGSGRQHVARTIHYAQDNSNTHHGPAAYDTDSSLIPLACSVLGPDLIRSTVAALAAGSSGEGARSRTLLLNEAERLPLEVQAELAAIFSEKTFSPRLIATSTQPLDDLAHKGQFREDLAAILGTIVIELPPLAQRRVDLPLLAQMFVERENAEGGKQIGGLSNEALDCLDGYDWPGNVDELALMIAEAHGNAAAATIMPNDLPKRIHLAARAAAHPHRPTETIVLDDFLDQIERELIERAMKRAKGNKAKAARMLGLTRPRLYRRLIQLGLEKGEPEKIPPEDSEIGEEQA